MKTLSVVLAVLAFASGLWAAYLWHQASRVQVIPFQEYEGRIEPVDPHQSQAEWIIALIDTAIQAGDLNRRAAKWTALAVALSTASALLSSL